MIWPGHRLNQKLLPTQSESEIPHSVISILKALQAKNLIAQYHTVVWLLVLSPRGFLHELFVTSPSIVLKVTGFTAAFDRALTMIIRRENHPHPLVQERRWEEQPTPLT